MLLKVKAVLGLAIGIPLAILCVRYVKSQLYEVHERECVGHGHRHWNTSFLFFI